MKRLIFMKLKTEARWSESTSPASRGLLFNEHERIAHRAQNEEAEEKRVAGQPA
jgi:hypothetical protein